MKTEMRSRIKAILCILAAALGFSLMTFFVRLSGDVPTMQKAFFRNAFAVFVALVPVLRSKETVLGMLFLHETPVLLSVVGYVIIIGTAVARWYYMLQRDRKEALG